MVVSIEGLKEIQDKAEQLVRDTKGGEMENAMRKATLLVERAAKKNLVPWRPPGGPGRAGVDLGELQSSITPSVTQDPLTGVVGSNVLYAPYQELGTRPHFVPAVYIGRWAKRHGLGERGVFVSGKALKYLQRALEDNLEKIKTLFEKAGKRMVHK